MTPKVLYKILTKEQWAASQNQPELSLTQDDQDFIHFSQENDIDKVVEKFFHGKDVVIVHIDPSKLKGRLVYEQNPGGEKFYYHLYDGHIPSAAILKSTHHVEKS